MLSAYVSIYLSVKDYKTENKMHTNIEYECEKIAAAMISTISFTKSSGRGKLGW